MRKVVVSKKIIPTGKENLSKVLNLPKDNLVIPAIKDDSWLESALESESKVIYVLYGNIINIASIVQKIKDAGKIALVHIDLIEGLSTKPISVDFIKKYTRADGIISIRPQMISRANKLDLISIQRFFLLDARNYDNVKKHVRENTPDIVEVMPAGLVKMIRYVLSEISTPLIASGLVLDEVDVKGALEAGAFAVSTINRSLWK